MRLVAVAALAACGRIDFAPRDDAPATSSCGHTFCDDFERTAPVVGDWTTSSTSGGTLSLDTGTLVADGTTVMPAAGAVYLAKSFPDPVSTSIHVEADVELDTGSDGEIDLVQIHWEDLPLTCTSFGYYLVRNRQTSTVIIQETYVGCGGSGSVDDTLPSFPAAAPSGTQHVAIDVTMGAKNAGAHLAVHVGDSLDLDKTVTLYDIPASHLSVRVGVPGVQANTGPWSVRYDNVIVDLL